MLTRTKLRTWLNVALLIATIVCIAGVALLDGVSTVGKAGLMGGYLAALLAVLPTIRKQGQEAIAALDLPECEPQDSTAAPGTRLTVVPTPLVQAPAQVQPVVTWTTVDRTEAPTPVLGVKVPPKGTL